MAFLLLNKTARLLLTLVVVVSWRSTEWGGVHAYDSVVIERLAKAASLSYLNVGERMTSSPYYSSLIPLEQVVDPVSESGATIFADQRNNPERIVVACRGSANLKNFGTNLKFKLVPPAASMWEGGNVVVDEGLVHEGFRDASLGLWGILGPKLRPLLTTKTTPHVTFTGHSLGAATALLCAAQYRSSETCEVPSPDCSVVTFGGPKLCDAAFATHLRTRVLNGVDVLHVVHDKDPILANNQVLWDQLGFEDVGVEVQCDPYSPKLLSQDEIETTGLPPWRNFAWNILDHCNYMGVFVGPRI